MSLITLLTDYGLADEYVGVCHGVIARIAPDARIIDLTHGVPAHDVRAGAMTLLRSLLYMPVGIHVAVVDPGVGSERRAVALKLADRRVLIGPDNGLLWPASRLGGGIDEAIEISDSPWRLEPVSPTFHGRDIFVPVAAMLARGANFEEAGLPLDPTTLTSLDMPAPRLEDGALFALVIGIDEFGNAQLAADATHLQQLNVVLGDHVQVSADDTPPRVVRVGRTFTDVAAGEVLIHEDSAGWLALAVNRGSAADELGLGIGDELRITGR